MELSAEHDQCAAVFHIYMFDQVLRVSYIKALRPCQFVSSPAA